MTVHLPDWYLAKGRRKPAEAVATLADVERARDAHARLWSRVPAAPAKSRKPAQAAPHARDWMPVASPNTIQETPGAEALPKPRITVSLIIQVVCDHYNLSRDELLSQRRNQSVVVPRQIAAYLAKIITTVSLTDIGRRFGDRDHTTIMHAVRKVGALAASDTVVAAQIDYLKTRILAAVQ